MYSLKERVQGKGTGKGYREREEKTMNCDK